MNPEKLRKTMLVMNMINDQFEIARVSKKIIGTMLEISEKPNTLKSGGTIEQLLS